MGDGWWALKKSVSEGFVEWESRQALFEPMSALSLPLSAHFCHVNALDLCVCSDLFLVQPYHSAKMVSRRTRLDGAENTL